MSGNASIQNRDIVMVGLQPWDTSIGSNCKDVALEFSRNNRVLYVNYPLDRGTLIKNRKDPKVKKRMDIIRGKENAIVQLKENLWNVYPDEIAESINWIPSEAIFTFFNKHNNKRLARSIRKAIKELGFTNIILFDDNDIIRSFYLKELLAPTTSIYYYRDYILGVDYWKLHGTKLEPLLIEKSDLCITNSLHFATYCRKYNPNTFYAGQGCNLDMFANRNDLVIPDDIAHFTGPLIGYVGALQSLRLSIDILAYIADEHPEWVIVLVGPEDEQFSVSDLHNRNNIYFTGARDPELLPAYINAFDICLNPQLINEVTIGNYPRKIDEYLAMGKPVVATTTELMTEVFSHYTYLGTTKEDYVALIEQALREDSRQKQEERKAYAATHSWENHVEEIYKAIKIVEAERQ
jgi:glycosyltransferase involved in cell wall biosynthesis